MRVRIGALRGCSSHWTWGVLALGMLLSGCKEDCSQAARLGDFEFSQGNYANAIGHYEKALRANARCGVVEEKLAEARRKASPAK